MCTHSSPSSNATFDRLVKSKLCRMIPTLRIAATVLILLSGFETAATAQNKSLSNQQINLTKFDSSFVIEVRDLPSDTLAALAELPKEDLDKQLSNALIVQVVENGKANSQPVFGATQLVNQTVRFTPRFDLRPGVTYRVTLKSPLPDRETDLSLPKKAQISSTRLTDVTPSAATVPENLLRFYLSFSSPMSRGEVYRRVRILDENNEEVRFAFLHLDEELWDSSHSRVTLLFDPGRIKRELRPRAEIGSPLRKGKRYSLVVDGDWPDAEGQPLTSSYRKTFEVSEHDDQCPDPKNWSISVPQAASQKPLAIEFQEPLDCAMLEHLIEVVDESGKELAGDISILKHESHWQFVPKEPWQAGRYSIRIATSLEDAAGNSIRKPFEVDLTQPFESPYPDEFVQLPFEIK